MEYSSSEIEPAVCCWTYMIMGHVEADINVLNIAKKELLTSLKILENHLLYNT